MDVCACVCGVGQKLAECLSLSPEHIRLHRLAKEILPRTGNKGMLRRAWLTELRSDNNWLSKPFTGLLHLVLIMRGVGEHSEVRCSLPVSLPLLQADHLPSKDH